MSSSAWCFQPPANGLTLDSSEISAVLIPTPGLFISMFTAHARRSCCSTTPSLWADSSAEPPSHPVLVHRHPLHRALNAPVPMRQGKTEMWTPTHREIVISKITHLTQVAGNVEESQRDNRINIKTKPNQPGDHEQHEEVRPWRSLGRGSFSYRVKPKPLGCPGPEASSLSSLWSQP
ncbi:uncharacterized protein LOC113920283 isoform X5 [Zalophus californianus]|uniref:Uncharacterized protein LOC113920283 isoform X5 n=1 Tax=Zalophus californianus TaxID=9704 RepID=A0A6P9FJ55_ZALCA|nr:uncharacterized protein LOC113920283 isoform X5 [Zalophus californianus]